MSGTNITLTLDKPYYVPGDIVAVHVTFDLDKEKKMRKFVITFDGQERASVTRGSGDSSRTYRCSTTLAKDHRQLAGPAQLRPGRYEWDVQFQVPSPTLPTFHHGTSTASAFAIRARADLKWKIDPTAMAEVVVVQPLPAYNPTTPIVHTSSHFGYENEKPGMQITIDDNSIPRGQELRGKLHITPGTKHKRMRSIDVKFFAQITATAKGHTDRFKKGVHSLSIPIDDASFKPELYFTIPVPGNIIPTFIGRCVAVRYFIHFNLDIAWGFDSKIKSEIVVL